MKSPGITIEPIYALIQSASPNAPGVANSHRYTCTVQYPEGHIAGVVVQYSVLDQFPPPMTVRPLRVGTVIQGYRVNGIDQWHFQCVPHHRSCSQ